MSERTILVAGVTGFVGAHVALAFLAAGWSVRGTMRDLGRGDALRRELAAEADVSRLEFRRADLSEDEGWDDAVRGCDAVAHVASPFPLGTPKDPDGELIRPAVDGTLRALAASLRNGVPRFVLTSSSVAVIYGHPADRRTPFTENDWTDTDSPEVTPYQRSKTLAERAARDLVARHGGAIHFSSVNPGFVLGPLAHGDFGASVEVVRMIMAGKYPGFPRIRFPCVDVRDVARLHVLAAETGQPSGGRYIACAECCWLSDLGRALRTRLGDAARKVPARGLPNWLVRAVALFDPALREIVPQLGRAVEVDDSRTRRALGIDRYVPPQEAVVATARSLIERRLV